MAKILCPNHKERTPSCHVYPDGLHCYACGFRAPHGTYSGINTALLPPEEEIEAEDLGRAFERIDRLPVSGVRGLQLPVGREGFYIPWPTRDYYKLRRDSDSGPKYVGARGHRRPLFWASQQGHQLFLVEGELNALSLALALPDWACCSPGGVGDFKSARIDKYYTQIKHYATITLVVDNDPPGAMAAIDALAYLRARGHRVSYLLMEPDANDVLVQEGAPALKNYVEDRLRRPMAGSP